MKYKNKNSGEIVTIEHIKVHGYYIGKIYYLSDGSEWQAYLFYENFTPIYFDNTDVEDDD